MATVYWGVDSVSRASDFGCSNEEITNATNAAGGANRVSFWGRYFGYKTSTWNPMNWDSHDTIVAELTAMKSIGIWRLAPLNSPGSIVSSTNKSDGQYHGKQACDGIVAVLNNCSGKLIMPASNTVYVYLDVEGCTTLSNQFWDGWNTTVNQYQFNGGWPFYACAYFWPGNCAGHGACGNHCSAVQSTGQCFGVWSNEPEPGPCSFPSGPGWGQQCFCDYPPPYTLLWQFVENCPCSQGVDLDYSTPGQDMAPTMLYLP